MKILKTRKIELIFKENPEENLKKLKDLQKQLRTLANHINSLYQVDFNIQWQKSITDETKFKYQHKKSLAYDYTKFFDIPSVFRLGTATAVEQKFKNDTKDVIAGTKTFCTYKKNLPMYFTVQSTVLNKNYLKDVKSDYELRIGGFDFITRLGKDKSNNKSILEKLKTSEYKFCDSSISIDKNKIFLNLVFSFEKQTGLLNNNIILGVDLGVKIPVVCAVLDKTNNSVIDTLNIDSKDRLSNIRYRFKKHRKSIQENSSFNKSGHGRTRKLERLNSLGSKEKNFVNTLHHTYAKQIVNLALKNNAGVINIEDLSGITKSNKYLNQNWGYFGLQSKIEDKAKSSGIIVNKINPKNTSRKCFNCGYTDKNNRTTQELFLCINCCHTENADLNAAKNIADV